MTVFVGTSGWQYADWRGAFYPGALPQRAWLSYYAERFQVVEVNSSFYRLPGRETVRRWAAETPDDFVFAMKMTRFLTHVKRLKDPVEPVQHFVEVARELGPKLGPILLQLPPSLQLDLDRLAATIDAMPRALRVAVELRHDSWYTGAVRDLLTGAGVALCIADRRGHVLGPEWRTSDWTYIRMHEGPGAPEPCYGPAVLRDRARHIHQAWSESADVYVFFNNDAHACAVEDARLLAEMLTRAGARVSRTPAPGAVRVGHPAAGGSEPPRRRAAGPP